MIKRLLLALLLTTQAHAAAPLIWGPSGAQLLQPALCFLDHTCMSTAGSSGVAWGAITGTLSSQSDLATALSGKQATLTPGSISTSTTGVSVGSGASSTIGPSVTLNVQTASNSQPGLLSAADHTSFAAKQSALTPGNASTSTIGVTITGTAATVGPAITVDVQTASNSQPGLLSAADHTSFAAKQAALTPGSVSTSTTGVTVGSGSSSTVGPNVTVDVQTATDSVPGLLSAADHTAQTANTAARHSAVTIGTANGLSLSTQALSLAAATDSVPGAMTTADHTTFTANTATLAAATSSATASTLAKRNGAGQLPFDSIGSSPVNATWYVDRNRTDTYTADGSFQRPYLTIQAAINAIAATGLNSASHIDTVNVVGSGPYAEALTFNSTGLVYIGLLGHGVASITSMTSTSNNDQLQEVYADGFIVTGDITFTGASNGTSFLSGNLYLDQIEIDGNVAITNAEFFTFQNTRIIGTLTETNVLSAIFSGGQGINSTTTLTHDNAQNKPAGLGASGTSLIVEKTVMGAVLNISAGATMTCREGTRIGTSGQTVTITGTMTDYGCIYRGNVTVASGGVWNANSSSYAGTLTNSGTITPSGQIIANAFVGDSGSGGKRGLVPAPAAGDAATKYLGADGTWSQPTGGTALGTSLVGYGDGSDGAVTLTASNTTTGPITAGSLTRDAYFSNLTISGSGALKLAGYKLYVNNTLNLTAASAASINCAGNAGIAAASATGAAAPTAAIANTVGVGGTGTAGGTGSTTTGAQAAAPTNQTPANGGASGTSGAGGLGSSGAGGATRAGATVASALPVRNQVQFLQRGVTLLVGGAGGPGGGGGGGDGTAGAGGGSGGNGGNVCYIAANILNRGGSTAASAVSAIGGVGGAGFTAPAGSRGGGGGGSAGGGGWIYFVYDTLLGSSATNMFDASGGVGGAGGNALGTGVGGNGGFGGAGGRVTLYQTSTASGSETFGSAGSVGGTASLLVGGTGGAANTVQVSL